MLSRCDAHHEMAVFGSVRFGACGSPLRQWLAVRPSQFDRARVRSPVRNRYEA
jgi:hypothetical protein